MIDFGKYSGRMLGTLPSSYLKWVSKNLRARDYQEWANRADEVLTDPVYADRIEWEHAQRILTGNEVSRVAGTRVHSNSYTQKPVSDLLEVSRRFGWDNDDKEGWGKVDFELLGTSKGGRIPRLKDKKRSSAAVPYHDSVDSSGSSFSTSSASIESDGDGDNVKSEVERRRELRRERQRMRKAEDGGGSGHQHQISVAGFSYPSSSPEGERRNPFPGRQAILRKLGAFTNRG